MTHFFCLWNWIYMVDNKITEELSLRLKNLGYHLIRVKLIELNGKKHCRLWQRELKIGRWILMIVFI